MRICLLLLLGCGLCGAEARADAYAKGVRAYKGYRFAQAIRHLSRGLKGKLSRAQRHRAHIMLAISHYNQTRPKQAAHHFRAALALDGKTPVPSGQSPPATAFFKRIRRSFRPTRTRSQKRLPPARKVVLSPDQITLLSRRRPAPSTPRRATSGRSSRSFWVRHRLSLLTGAVGILALAAGGGVALAFLGRHDAFKQRQRNTQNTGESVWNTYLQAQDLALPANILLISGASVTLAAGGIFLVELLTQPKQPRP